MSTAPAFSPGPCSTRGPLGRQRLQVHARALVAAVLRPHHGEDAQLGRGSARGRATRRSAVLVGASGRGARGCLVVRRCIVMRGRSRAARATAPDANGGTTDSNITQAVGLPSAISQARSGCGIRPTTLRRSLQMPAMLFDRAVGIRLVGRRRPRRRVAEDDLAVLLEPPQHVGRRVVVAFAVRDRNAEHLPGGTRAGERRVGLLDADVARARSGT